MHIKSESEKMGKRSNDRDGLGSNCRGKGCIRFYTPDEMREYFDYTGRQEVVFRAYPIAGEPEDFRYLDHEQTVVRLKDGKIFDSMEDFFCYAFQCDAEGYPRTEYVDLVDLTSSSPADSSV